MTQNRCEATARCISVIGCLGSASINRESDPDGGELTPEMSFLACLAHRAELLENR